MTKKLKVESILEKMGNDIREEDISTKDNTIDFKKLGNSLIFKKAIKELKAINVNDEYLRKNGFLPAMLIMARYLR